MRSARPKKPRDKAKVEVGVQIAQRWIIARLRNRTFFSLGELNAAIAELLEELNDCGFAKLQEPRKTRFVIHVARGTLNRHLLAIVAAAACFGVLTAAACSTHELPSSGSTACIPTAGRRGRYAPARPLHPSACSSQQLDAYYKACPFAFGAKPLCDEFAQQNPECFHCVRSTLDDETWAAHVTFGDGVEGFANAGGCIAIMQGGTVTGCGPALDRYLDCRDEACRGCPTSTAAETLDLQLCAESQDAGDICGEELATYNLACADLGPSDPAYACIRLPNEPFDALFRRYAQMWCGPPGDAGTDGG